MLNFRYRQDVGTGKIAWDDFLNFKKQLASEVNMNSVRRWKNALRWTTALAVVAGCCCTIGAEARASNARTEWGKRLAGGPVKAVFLAPYGAQHDSFELMQRFEIDGTVLTMSSFDINGYIDWGFRVVGHFWPDLIPTEEQVLANMRRALSSEWEVVVMSRTPPWYRYPQDIRRSLLKKIAAGRGMMVGGLEDSLRKDIKEMGLGLEETAIGADRFVFRVGENGGYQGHARLYRCGKGRLIHFYANNHPAHGYLLSASVRQSDFEFSAARAGWFLLRAARSKARQLVTATRFDNGQIEIQLNGASGTSVQIAVHRRDSYEKVLDTRTKTRPGELVRVDLPQLPGGQYHAEVRVTDRNSVTVDWDAIRFTVPSDVQFNLSIVNQDDLEVSAGDRLHCRLDAEGETANLEVVTKWYDNWDRLLLSTDPQPFSNEMELAAPMGSLSVLNRLEMTVHSQRGPEAVASVEVLMPENVRPTDFHMLYWKHDVEKRYSPDSWRRRQQWNVLRRDAAADAWADGMPYVNEARDAALCHLRTVPYTSSFHATSLDKELLNEQWLVDAEKLARKRARNFRPYNPLGHTLGDENFVNFKRDGRIPESAASWTKFGQYLRQVYPDMEALNDQWGSDFASWDDIRFDNEQQMLPSMDNPSAWVDFRAFVTRSFTDGHRRMRKAIRQEDPDAWVGWDGAAKFSSYSGIDWWELSQDMEMLNVYHTSYLVDEKSPWGIFNGEAISSFGDNAALRGCWINAANRQYGGAYVPWYLLLNGMNSTWWWQATFLHPANGPLRWDLGLTPVAESMAKSVRQIKRGPGTLLAHARKEISPIAVHYSAVNWHASTIESGVANHVGNLGIGVAFWMAPNLAARIYEDEEMKQIWGGVTPKGHYAVASANVYTLLHDIGFEPRTLARQQIEAGALATSGTRVLILPFVVSLSDQEIDQIRQFVAGGGVLIADYRCGLRDSHGRIRPQPALDDLFGIQRENLEVRRGRARLVADIAGGVQFETMFHDPVTRDTAEARAYHDDGTPAFFTHPHGAGQAVYLNTDLYGYIGLRRSGQERRLREAFATLLVQTNHLYPPFQIKHPDGSAAGRVEVTQFTDGRVRYYGVLPAFDVDDRKPRDVVLPFPARTHVYDVRTQQYLGSGGPTNATINPGQARMYAALPYVVDSLTIGAPQQATQGEPVEIAISVVAQTDDMGPHAIHVEVSDPHGHQQEHLTRTVYLPRGTGYFSFVPAFNSPTGHWAITAAEVVSGKQVTAQFHIDSRH